MPGFKGSLIAGSYVKYICRAALVALLIVVGLGSLSMRDVTGKQAQGGVTHPATAVVLVVIDSLSLEDINQEVMPALARLAEIGSIGLMNGRTAKTQQPEHAYITIGAGTRAQGPVETGHAFNSQEELEGARASEVYIRNTGEPVPPGESVVHPYIASVIRANTGLSYEIVPGALGEALRRAGKRTAVFGNSDALAGPSRYAVSIAMDKRGLVDTGDVGPSVTLERLDFPGGVVSDVPRLCEAAKAAMGVQGQGLEKADLIVIESGDTARVERMWLSGAITREAYSRARRKALASADNLILEILEFADLRDSVLMVVAPTPSSDASQEGYLLTPVVMAGKGFSEGLLTSATTRRMGLVTNTDVAATILRSLGVPIPPWILGAGMTSIPELQPMDSVTDLLQRTAFVSGIRTPHLKTYVSFLIITALGLPILIAMKSRVEPEGKTAPWKKTTVEGGVMTEGQTVTERRTDVGKGVMGHGLDNLASYTLLAVPGLPLVWLIMPLATMLNRIPPGLLTIAVSFVIYMAATIGFRTLEGRFTAICLIIGMGVIIDALTGAGLMKYSVLGYDPIGGARFYGIGNEYMGVLIGSLTVGCGLLVDLVDPHARSPAHRQILMVFIFLLFATATLVLALPGVGANLGGTCAAIAGFGVAYTRFSRRPVTASQVIGSVALGVLVILTIASIDSVQAGGPLSHWGRTLLWVRESGIQVILDAIRRKASMSLKLIRYTIWTRALLVFLAVLAFIGFRPVGSARKILAERPGFAASLSACLVAGGVSLLANDSGIVSAALITMYPSLVLLGLAWQESK